MKILKLHRYILIIVYIFFCTSCKHTNLSKSTEISDVSLQTRDSISFDQFIKNKEGSYHVHKNKMPHELQALSTSLNNQKTDHNKQNWFYNIKKKTFYPIFEYKKNQITIIGAFTEYFGENDIPGVTFELHTLSPTGHQIDYLIVYNRFHSELVLKTEFTTKQDFSSITLHHTEADWIELNEQNDIVGTRTKPLVKTSTQKFQISEDGKFLEIL